MGPFTPAIVKDIVATAIRGMVDKGEQFEPNAVETICNGLPIELMGKEELIDEINRRIELVRRFRGSMN